VLDYDDAIFHGYDLNKSKLIRRILGDKIDRLMQNSTLVIAGNAYLAKRAKESLAYRVQILPTVIDLNKYSSKDYQADNDSIPSLVWIGSPSTIHYLGTLENSLRELSLNFKFKLVVIGSSISLPGVMVEVVAWSEESENSNIMKCDIGIMPLIDSPWERGKCGYKIIQYMASGLPVVASNIGANSTIIENGRSGFLVDTTEEWVSVLSRLLVAPRLREQMGGAGRKIVEERFCVQRTGPKLVEHLITSLE
jgi:glycosyltransferase involved in cell wall biosynthesis